MNQLHCTRGFGTIKQHHLFISRVLHFQACF
uniref:Uncharacterized protein n=1 Tax=Arundo donax TaxID=35708 RepID=A0A0A9GF52_ARUDO